MNVHAGLPDISQVRPRTEADAPLFQELAAVLARHGALDRFGVVLLHNHFPLAEDEVMLEHTDITSRTQTLTPVKGPVGKAIETSWRLGPNGEAMMRCICPEDSQGNHSGSHIRVGM